MQMESDHRGIWMESEPPRPNGIRPPRRFRSADGLALKGPCLRLSGITNLVSPVPFPCFEQGVRIRTLAKVDGFARKHARPFEPQSEVIFGRFRQLLAINALKMAPITSKRLQGRAWNDPTKGLLWNTAGAHLPKLLEEGGVVRIREQLQALVPVVHLHTTGKLVSGLDQS